MAISAYLDAARVLDMEAPRVFAIRTLDRILDESWDGEAGLRHVVAYPEGPGSAQPVAGVLDDYALLTHACADAWAATGQLKYYEAAMRLAESMMSRFYDAEGGAFFDTEQGGGDKLGALAARRKPMQDSPTPAGNATAASALLRLEALSGRQDFRDRAEATLAAFGGVIEHYGLYAGSYGLALERLSLAPVQVVIIGEEADARRLAAVANARYAVNKTVVVLRAEDARAEALPPVLAETLPHLPQLSGGQRKAMALVCQGNTCLPPAQTAEALIEQINAGL
jgi:hypothetical protein